MLSGSVHKDVIMADRSWPQMIISGRSVLTRKAKTTWMQIHLILPFPPTSGSSRPGCPRSIFHDHQRTTTVTLLMLLLLQSVCGAQTFRMAD